MARTLSRFASSKSANVRTLSTSIDWDAVNAAASTVTALSGDEIPPGWFTADQYAEHLDKHRETAWRKLKAMVVAGKAESKQFRIKQQTGRLYPVQHYRVIP